MIAAVAATGGHEGGHEGGHGTNRDPQASSGAERGRLGDGAGWELGGGGGGGGRPDAGRGGAQRPIGSDGHAG